MCQYSVFNGEYENAKETGQKILTFPDGDCEYTNKHGQSKHNSRKISFVYAKSTNNKDKAKKQKGRFFSCYSVIHNSIAPSKGL